MISVENSFFSLSFLTLLSISSMENSIKHLEKLALILHDLFQKNESRISPFYAVGISLITKPDKEYKKEYTQDYRYTNS